jgi:hypothetical protein
MGAICTVQHDSGWTVHQSPTPKHSLYVSASLPLPPSSSAPELELKGAPRVPEGADSMLPALAAEPVRHSPVQHRAAAGSVQAPASDDSHAAQACSCCIGQHNAAEQLQGLTHMLPMQVHRGLCARGEGGAASAAASPSPTCSLPCCSCSCAASPQHGSRKLELLLLLLGRGGGARCRAVAAAAAA